MSSTTITLISNYKFEKDYESKLGSLMFPTEWYDCLCYVNTTKLRKNLPKLPKGSKILGVLVPTTNNPEFVNQQNTAVPYETPVCADKTTDGAYYKTYPNMGGFAMWATDHPVGNAIIVVSKHPDDYQADMAMDEEIAKCKKNKK
jgi:hypothetical protein